MENNINIKELMSQRNEALKEEHTAYIRSMRNYNLRADRIIGRDFGIKLVELSVSDIAGEVVRRYFNFGDLYITADQLMDRVLNFSYDNPHDCLSRTASETFYHQDFWNSASMKKLDDTMQNAQEKLFDLDRKKDTQEAKSRSDYRKSRTDDDGNLVDDINGEKTKDVQADHIIPRAAATYNKRYIREERKQQVRDYYYSDKNLQLINSAANNSKSDVRVCDVDGEIEYLTSKEINKGIDDGKNIKDITNRANADQLTNATVKRWENATANQKQKLKDAGYLDENGKVTDKARKAEKDRITRSLNDESKMILDVTDYFAVTKDAGKEAVSGIGKVICGQVIYYTLPPVVFEVKNLVVQKDMTLNKFFDESKKACVRVSNYVLGCIEPLINNTIFNSISKFVKSFMDILIYATKELVKKLLKIAKEVAMSLVTCVKVIANPKASSAQKADSVTQILSVTVATVAIEIVSEYLEDVLHVPNFISEPLQLILTIVVTDLIILILEDADLFNLRYGFIIENIDAAWREEYQIYSNELSELEGDMNLNDREIQGLLLQIDDATEAINSLDLQKKSVESDLDTINKAFSMGIDFCSEWKDFLGENL